MSAHDGSPPPEHPPGPEHASIGTYVKVAAILTVVTALEFAVIYIRALTPILVPLLIVMSAGKFALVVLFFMHLRYDNRALTALFVGPLVLAVGLGLALATLTGAFLLFGR
ncbi:MAG TPA: cytochrome C oxidase subunit IV family protein [Candidatus Limnocylindria bacterium]|nr:cytochrome C oxidase subunit IV family protein [Candidatus Limnocylindria bacterium]